MKQRLYNILVVLSAIICMGLLVLMVRSFWVGDAWLWQYTVYDPVDGEDDAEQMYARRVRIYTGRGGVTFFASHVESRRFRSTRSRLPIDPFPPGFRFSHSSIGSPWYPYEALTPLQVHLGIEAAEIRFLGFQYFVGSDHWDDDIGIAQGARRNLTFPLVVPLALAAVLPVRRLIAIRRRRRAVRLGLCVHCGYNLTGNVSGTCPECGAPVPPAQRQ